MRGGPQISASILNADFGRLADEVRRADRAGVDSIHLDVMDGHFVDNLTMGPVVVEAVRPASDLPYHAHLMIDNPLVYASRFADAGSDLIVFHVEVSDGPADVIAATLTGDGEFLPYFFKCMRFSVFKAKSHFHNFLFTL